MRLLLLRTWRRCNWWILRISSDLYTRSDFKFFYLFIYFILKMDAVSGPCLSDDCVLPFRYLHYCRLMTSRSWAGLSAWTTECENRRVPLSVNSGDFSYYHFYMALLSMTLFILNVDYIRAVNLYTSLEWSFYFPNLFQIVL